VVIGVIFSNETFSLKCELEKPALYETLMPQARLH